MVQKRIGETEFCVEINILNEQKQHLMDDSLNLQIGEDCRREMLLMLLSKLLLWLSNTWYFYQITATKFRARSLANAND